MGGGYGHDATFRAYILDPHYMGVEISIPTKTFESHRNYSHRCSYTEPAHSVTSDEIIAEMKFVCDNVFGPKEYNGVYYKAEAVADDGVRGHNILSFARDNVNISTVNGKTQIIKTMKWDKDYMKGEEGGQLGKFIMKMKPDFFGNDEHPVRYFEYFIEDNKSLDGSRDNPFIPGLFSLLFSTVNHGSSMEAREQAYVYCRAVGHDIPDTNVYKQTSDGNEIPLDYPRFDVRTKFSVSVHYVINFPSVHDAGNFTCRARHGNKEQSSNDVARFEQPNHK